MSQYVTDDAGAKGVDNGNGDPEIIRTAHCFRSSDMLSLVIMMMMMVIQKLYRQGYVSDLPTCLWWW